MSLAGKRAAFKVALDTVAGCTGYTSKPSTPRTGDAWPQLGTGERDEDAGMFAWTWYVGVMLPADRAAADEWIDSHLDALTSAIWAGSLGLVEAASPTNLGTDSSYIYGLLLTVRSD